MRERGREPVLGPPLVLTDDGAIPCQCAMGGGARHWHRVTLDELARMTAPRGRVVWRGAAEAAPPSPWPWGALWPPTWWPK